MCSISKILKTCLQIPPTPRFLRSLHTPMPTGGAGVGEITRQSSMGKELPTSASPDLHFSLQRELPHLMHHTPRPYWWGRCWPSHYAKVPCPKELPTPASPETSQRHICNINNMHKHKDHVPIHHRFTGGVGVWQSQSHTRSSMPLESHTGLTRNSRQDYWQQRNHTRRPSCNIWWGRCLAKTIRQKFFATALQHRPHQKPFPQDHQLIRTMHQNPSCIRPIGSQCPHAPRTSAGGVGVLCIRTSHRPHQKAPSGYSGHTQYAPKPQATKKIKPTGLHAPRLSCPAGGVGVSIPKELHANLTRIPTSDSAAFKSQVQRFSMFKVFPYSNSLIHQLVGSVLGKYSQKFHATGTSHRPHQKLSPSSTCIKTP